MNDETKEVKDLDNILVAGDQWLINHGVVTDLTHNNIVLNLYMNFPVEYVEYFMNTEEKAILVKVYIKFWKTLFTNKNKLLNRIFDLLSSYLKGYAIKVEVLRYKKSIKEQTNEAEKEEQ